MVGNPIVRFFCPCPVCEGLQDDTQYELAADGSMPVSARIYTRCGMAVNVQAVAVKARDK